MERFLTSVLAALEEAGIPAIRRLPGGSMPRLTEPRAAVGLERIKAAPGAAYEYLGTENSPEHGPVERYGRRLEAVLLVRVFAPDGQDVSGKVCMALSGAFPGVTVQEITAEMAEFDPVADCFVTQVRVTASAYLYATARGDEDEFLDFRLEGEVK